MRYGGHTIYDLHMIGEFVQWALSVAETTEEKTNIAHIFVGDIQFYTSDEEFRQIAAALITELAPFLEPVKPDNVVK